MTYLTHRGAYRPTHSSRLWYVLGLVWGLALWDHLISVAYVAASAGWLALRAARRDAPGPGRGWALR